MSEDPGRLHHHPQCRTELCDSRLFHAAEAQVAGHVGHEVDASVLGGECLDGVQVCQVADEWDGALREESAKVLRPTSLRSTPSTTAPSATAC